MNTLVEYGWTEKHQRAWDTMKTIDVQPARVIADFGTSLKIATPLVISAELSGKLAHYTDGEHTHKVGDWVSVTVSANGNATIESVVFRSNDIVRKVTGKRTKKQIIAVNIDIAFVLLALDNNFSVERLKRFLYQLSVSCIDPVIVLNKADKTDDVQEYIAQLEHLGIPIITTIATLGDGVNAIAERISPTKTAILLGSSGVGKSTLTNALLGRSAQATNNVRENDASGKHTTVHKELFILPNGGILIDTPGIRELQLWGTEDDLDISYGDITILAAQCRYTNCRHTSEPGCRINKALSEGTLDAKHYANYVKMKRELAELEARNTEKIRNTKRRDAETKKSKIEAFDDDQED